MGFQLHSGGSSGISPQKRRDVISIVRVCFTIVAPKAVLDDTCILSKDAEDLLFFMENYAEAGNEDRLFDGEVELLQLEGFDLVLAGIRLLGRDIAAIADKATGTAILEILEAETGDQQRYRLVQDMAGSARTHDRSDEVLTKIMRLKQGFLEAAV